MLVGLLLAEWRRRKYRRPVVYACPTHQLARQVADAASREGIDALLWSGQGWTGPSTNYRDTARRCRSAALAVVGVGDVPLPGAGLVIALSGQMP